MQRNGRAAGRGLARYQPNRITNRDTLRNDIVVEELGLFDFRIADELAPPLFVAWGSVERWQEARDLRMPGMDGRELAGKLRERFPEDGLRLIALSGENSSDTGGRWESAVFDEWLSKPVGLNDLLWALVENPIRRRPDPLRA